MVRYLSGAWFEALDDHGRAPAGRADCVIRHVVTGGPEGRVCYHVVIAGDAAVVRPGDSAEASLTFTSDYPIAAAITRGELSAETALLDGKVRVAGNVAAAASHLRRLGGRDLLPPSVRETTTF